MKIIITESQNNKLWLLRRYEFVKESFDETVLLFNQNQHLNICMFDSFDDYERRFILIMMDDLHPLYYLIDDFDYEGIMSELKDMFYVELTELFYERNC